jgi:hypothetical protein
MKKLIFPQFENYSTVEGYDYLIKLFSKSEDKLKTANYLNKIV